MKISIITTITNPDDMQYAWIEAIDSYGALADELIIVNGGKEIFYDHPDNTRRVETKVLNLPWPEDWHWSELPIHLNAGLKEATGDWVIKMDTDYVIHETDIPAIRRALEVNAKNYAVASFMKKIIINRNSYYKKCRTPLAINKKKVGDTIKFGKADNSDWCYPIIVK